jgi:hypothetical protein
MMSDILARGDILARRAQQRTIRAIADRLNALTQASVQVEEARVLVTGRGLIKRWLIDPELRFLSRDSK